MSLTEDELRAAIAREMPGVRADLERLVRIPGIAFEGFDHSHVERSAEAVAELLRGCGLDVQIVRGGGQPAVIGRKAGARPARRPCCSTRTTTCSPPATRRCGRATRSSRSSATGGSTAAAPPTTRPASWRTSPRCGRSATRCRSGWCSSSRARRSTAPTRSTSCSPTHQETLRSDVIVIADSGNWDIGVPALTTSLRGLVNCFVEVSTLQSAVHSGMFGGAGARTR